MQGFCPSLPPTPTPNPSSHTCIKTYRACWVCAFVIDKMVAQGKVHWAPLGCAPGLLPGRGASWALGAWRSLGCMPSTAHSTLPATYYSSTLQYWISPGLVHHRVAGGVAWLTAQLVWTLHRNRVCAADHIFTHVVCITCWLPAWMLLV